MGTDDEPSDAGGDARPRRIEHDVPQTIEQERRRGGQRFLVPPNEARPQAVTLPDLPQADRGLARLVELARHGDDLHPAARHDEREQLAVSNEELEQRLVARQGGLNGDRIGLGIRSGSPSPRDPDLEALSVPLQSGQRLRALSPPRREIASAGTGPGPLPLAPGVRESPGSLARVEPVKLFSRCFERSQVLVDPAAGPRGGPAERGPRGARPLAPKELPARPPFEPSVEREVEEFIPPSEPARPPGLERQERLESPGPGVSAFQGFPRGTRGADSPRPEGARDGESVVDPGILQRARSPSDHRKVAIRLARAALQLLLREQESRFQLADGRSAPL